MTDRARSQMQKCLDDLGVPLTLCWVPDVTKGVHGEIKEKTLYIYDSEEGDAWGTLIHEIIEYRLKDLTVVYRTLINKLVEGYEALCYQKKEQFVESLPHVFEIIEKAKRHSE